MRAEHEAGIKHLLNAHDLRCQRRPAPFVTLDLDLLQFIGLEAMSIGNALSALRSVSGSPA
jgi:hypothetical protein